MGVSTFFEYNGLIVKSSHHNLLHLDIIAIDQAQDIHARRHVGCRDAMLCVSRMYHPSRNIYHLQRAFAIDDNIPVADEREGFIVAVCVPANEHQFEATGVVSGFGLEGVIPLAPFRKGEPSEQVNICACKIIDEMQIAHLHAFGVDGNGIGAILGGLKVQRQFALGIGIGDGVFFPVLRDVELGAAFAEAELLQRLPAVEADDGVIES